jgi:hypothetical protein
VLRAPASVGRLGSAAEVPVAVGAIAWLLRRAPRSGRRAAREGAIGSRRSCLGDCTAEAMGLSIVWSG